MNNRKDKRFPEKNKALLKAGFPGLENGGNGGFNAYTHDLSLSGARVCCKQDFPVGHNVRIVIDLERSRQSLKVDGEVIWSRKSKKGKQFDIGVEFQHSISETILSLIKHFYGKETGIPSMVS